MERDEDSRNLVLTARILLYLKRILHHFGIMRLLSGILRAPLLFFFMLAAYQSSGQLTIQTGPEVTPVFLVECILGDGVWFENVAYQGADVARGVFSHGDSTNLGIKCGAFLTTGSGYDIPGPNSSSGISTGNSMPGHPALNALTTGTTYDASVLEFDFIAESDTLRIHYVFGSEDYNESVFSLYNDVCGIFLSGPNPAGGIYPNLNIAKVPETGLNVSAYTINNGMAPSFIVPNGPCENCQYFQDNTFGTTLEYDGFTTVLTAWALTIPCEIYHLKIGVADVGDDIYDSGIFIAHNSIERGGITHETILVPPGLGDNLLEGVIGADVVFRLPDISWSPFLLEFQDVLGTADPSAYPDGDFEEEIPSSVSFGLGSDSAAFHVMPVMDGIYEGEESVQLVYLDTLGCFPVQDTVDLIIEDFTNMWLNVSPSTFICQGQEVSLWVDVINGFPPFSFLWEPGGFVTDIITVNPDTTTTYYIYVSDLVDTVIDSVLVTVLPHNYDVLTYSFDKMNNPQLPWDVFGEIGEDSISLDVPAGTDVTDLIATFALEDGAYVYVSNVYQVSGVTPNDFSEPVPYHVIGMPSGCAKDWTVAVNIATNDIAFAEENIQVIPNPARDRISIHNAPGSEAILINNIGQKVLQKAISGKNYDLQVAHLPEGIYYLRIACDEKQHLHKIIISR